MNKYLIIPNDKDLYKFKAKGFNSFILPLNNYSLGFDVYFNVDEINKYSNDMNIYLMINKFMHKEDLVNLENIINSINIGSIKGMFIEDLGVLDFFPKDKCIIYQNHMINNFFSINFFYSLGYSNVVVNNELTIKEIKEIRKKTASTLYYFIVSKNILMYSNRKLVSNYFKHYSENQEHSSYLIRESVSKKELIAKEELDSATISNNDIFCGNKYINDLEKLDYLIINLSNINQSDTNIILDNYNNSELYKLIACDYYFLENDIKYKVGDLK